MKKYISLALVLGMMLTLVGVIPAEAKVYEEYPYIYSDFEDPSSISELASGRNDSQWEAGGAGGSAGALHITQQSKGDGPMQDHQFIIPDAHFMLESKFKMSAWIKLDTTKTKLKDQTFGFVFWAPAVNDKDGSTSSSRWMTGWTVTDDRFNSGEWVYVEKIVSWNGAMNSGWTMDPDAEGTFQFGARLGNVGAGVFGGAVAEDSPSQTELSWYLDDFIVEPVLDEYVPAEEPEEDSAYLANIDFSNPDFSVYGVKPFNGAPATNIQYNDGIGPDGKPGYLSHVSTKEQNVYSDICFTSAFPFRYNKLYKLSFDVKVDDPELAGISRVKLCVMRDGRLDFTNDVGVYGGSNKYQYIVTPKELTTEWKHYEIYMMRNLRTFDEKNVSLQIRVCSPDKKAELGAADEGKEGSSFSLDNLVIEEFDVPANGDFEWLKSDIPVTEMVSGSDDSKRYGTFYAWFQDGATVEESANVPADSTGTRSAKITTTAANGGISQGVFIENNTENEITFWAKGEGASVGKSIQVKLDRAVATKDPKDVYVVPDTELLGENLVLTDVWTKYTIPYSCAFPTPAGADPNAGPRQPFLSFVVDGGAADMTYYLDDVSIQQTQAPAPSYPLPYATDLMIDSSNIVDATATFSYAYNSDLDLYEGNSVVRVKKLLDDGTSVTLAQMSAPTNIYEYVIPEAAIGSKLVFEVMPFAESEEGQAPISGAVYRIETTDVIHAARVITPTLGEFNAEEGSITGTLSVENNMADGSDINLFLAIVLYDEEDGIVRYDSKPISVTNGASDSITLTVVTANDPELMPVAKARAFVWGGTSIFDTDMVSYADMIEVTK